MIDASRRARSLRALIDGHFPDSCTRLDQVHQQQLGSEIEVEITTRRPADANCPPVLVPFEKTLLLDLDAYGGDLYRLTVNGVSVSFELPLADDPDLDDEPDPGRHFPWPTP